MRINQKQPWGLTKARYHFSITEDRIFRQIIHRMQHLMSFDSKSFNEDFETELKVKDILPSHASTNHLAVGKALKVLREQTITFYREETDDFVFTGIILEAIYSKTRETVIIRLSKHLMPYLTSFKQGFTKYSLEIAKSFRSPYTVRIYEYLAHMINGRRSISNIDLLSESLKARLGIDGKYKRASTVKAFILEPAQKELKAKADVWFEIKEPIKEGRKVVGWKIQIFKKEEPKKAAPAQPKKQGKDTIPQPLQFDYKMIK